MARRIVLRRRHFGMLELQPVYLLVTTLGSQLVVAFYIAALEALDAQCRKTCMIGADDVFGRDVPAYDLRRLILPRDPLASSLAFSVQIRLVLATILGFRMCEDCPHCVDSDKPCIDAFGSCAESMGGVAGRCDSIPGAVE